MSQMRTDKKKKKNMGLIGNRSDRAPKKTTKKKACETGWGTAKSRGPGSEKSETKDTKEIGGSMALAKKGEARGAMVRRSGDGERWLWFKVLNLG